MGNEFCKDDNIVTTQIVSQSRVQMKKYKNQKQIPKNDSNLKVPQQQGQNNQKSVQQKNNSKDTSASLITNQEFPSKININVSDPRVSNIDPPRLMTEIIPATQSSLSNSKCRFGHVSFTYRYSKPSNPQLLLCPKCSKKFPALAFCRSCQFKCCNGCQCLSHRQQCPCSFIFKVLPLSTPKQSKFYCVACNGYTTSICMCTICGYQVCGCVIVRHEDVCGSGNGNVDADVQGGRIESISAKPGSRGKGWIGKKIQCCFCRCSTASQDCVYCKICMAYGCSNCMKQQQKAKTQTCICQISPKTVCNKTCVYCKYLQQGSQQMMVCNKCGIYMCKYCYQFQHLQAMKNRKDQASSDAASNRYYQLARKIANDQ